MNAVSRFENPNPFKNGDFSKSGMPNDPVPLKTLSPSILDRFRGMVKEREANLRVSGGGRDGTDSNLNTDEIVRIYETVLAELTLNSKPIITDLTMIAGEQRAHGKGIAEAICARIIEVPVEQKLPSLYLLDSIVKNIGNEYIRHFSARLPEVFCEVYAQVHLNMRPAMRHLFGTWATVFPTSVLRTIEVQLQFSPPVNRQPFGLTPGKASESLRPTYGTHKNPERWEARNQIEHLTVDAVGAKALSSTGHTRTGHTTSGTDAGKQLPSSAVRGTMSSSPYVAEHERSPSPSLDEFGVDGSPRISERASPPHSGFVYGLRRLMDRDEETSKLRARNWHGDPDHRLKDSAILNNGIDLRGPRALISAYGIDQRDKKLNHKHSKVEQLGVNSFDQKTAFGTWQNTEEEEFDWKHMNPTIALQSRHNDFYSSSTPPIGDLMERHDLATQQAAPLVTDYRSNQSKAQFSSSTDSSVVEDVPHDTSDNARGSWNLPHQMSEHYLNAGSSSYLSADGQFRRSPNVMSSISSTFDSAPEIRSTDAPDLRKAWHPARLQKSHPLPSLSAVPLQMHASGQFHSRNTGSMLQTNLPLVPSQLSRPAPLNLQNPAISSIVHPHSLVTQKVQHNLNLPSSAAAPSHALQPSSKFGNAVQGRELPTSINLSNLVPGVQSSLPILNAPNTSFRLPGTTFPSLPRGPPPGTPQLMHIPQSKGQIAPNPPAQGAFSGLLSSLMEKGLISLPKQDSLGVEFDADLLKVRHESAITALYADLPRQCKTCGIRFKSQEEHSKHMDWHVNKNRTLKNRKLKPSPKWFVSISMWLSGAEALGTDVVPRFLPSDNNVEKQEDEEMAVPADEDQNACALCGEPFDDFYSDEMEEWMYKGAVYMNAPVGSTAGMARSQLGPIVHAKCRSDSHAIPSEDFTTDEVELTEDGHQRKKMRI